MWPRMPRVMEVNVPRTQKKVIVIATTAFSTFLQSEVASCERSHVLTEFHAPGCVNPLIGIYILKILVKITFHH